MLLDQLLANLGVQVGHVTVDDVAAGDRLALRQRPETLILFGIQGRGTLRGTAGQQQLAAGWLGVVPPETPVSFIAGPDALAVACGELRVTYHTGSDLFAALPGPLTFDMRDDPDVAAAFGSLVHESRDPRPGAAFMGTALANQALVALLRAVCDHPDCRVPWLEALEDPAVAPALQAILTRPGQPHSVDSLAAGANLSRAAFHRRFSAATGQAPMSYLREVRMREAARLLSAGQPVSAVAKAVGYTSRSQFTAAFRRQYGTSPGEFRGPALARA